MGLCTTAIHRVGVVSFGTNSQIDMPLTKIAPENQAAWDQVKGVLSDKIRSQNLDATDPAKAFKEAYMMLKAAPPFGDLPRKQAIISLTDGKACVPTKGCRAATGDGMDHELYNRLFVDQVNEDFEFSDDLMQQDEALRKAAEQFGGIGNIPDTTKFDILYNDYPVSRDDLRESTYIWIIAMNSAENYLEIDGDALSQIAKTHGGQLIALPENRIAVPREFNKILSWLSGISPTILRCGKLAVDPYLGGAILDVYKAAEGFDLKITHNGKTLVGGQGDREYFGVVDYSQFGVIEHYRFQKPPAGLWQVDAPTNSDCESLEVAYIPFRSKVTMISPLGMLPNYNLNDATFDPAHPFSLQYKITDAAEGITLDEDLTYPLDIKAKVGLPDGTSQEVAFTFEEEGIWKSTPIPVHILGTYTVDLSAYAPCIENPDLAQSRCSDRPKILVVQDANGTYQVGEVSLFEFKILSPGDGSTITLHGNLWPEQLALQPINVVVQMVDANGTPLLADTVLTGDLNRAFMATLSAPGNQVQSLVMQPDPTDPSRYIVSFSSPAVLGKHTLTIDLTSDYRYETYSPAKNQITSSFTRYDGLLNNPTFYMFIGGLLLLGLIGIVAWVMLNRKSAVFGRLILSDNSGTKLYSLSQKKSVVTLTTNLPFGVKKVIVTNAGVNAGKQLIKIVIKQAKGTDATRTLVDGGPETPATATLRAKYEWGGKPTK